MNSNETKMMEKQKGSSLLELFQKDFLESIIDGR
jgi:hypothetical protein